MAKKAKTYNASDSAQVEEAKKLANFEKSNKSKFVHGAMQTEEGRKFFYDLLVFCSIFHTPFTADNNKTNFNCGKQNVGLKILADIQESAPDEYILMCKEGREA
ncbi:MAG: hypothetical protein KGJ90_05050 [Patescibacteria group bacterium]|nr:hypothetical protein [Patescibacteria group bacterium]